MLPRRLLCAGRQPLRCGAIRGWQRHQPDPQQIRNPSAGLQPARLRTRFNVFVPRRTPAWMRFRGRKLGRKSGSSTPPRLGLGFPSHSGRTTHPRTSVFMEQQTLRWRRPSQCCMHSAGLVTTGIGDRSLATGQTAQRHSARLIGPRLLYDMKHWTCWRFCRPVTLTMADYGAVGVLATISPYSNDCG